MRELKPVDVLDMAEQSGLARTRRRRLPDREEVVVFAGNRPPRYLVCNCDEAEPGTFKDHMLLEERPAPYYRGDADRRVRASARTMRSSISAASSSAATKSSARRSKRRATPATSARTSSAAATILEITVHRGAGAYICGEETGLLNSLEGKRGEPRLKPPFPAIEGSTACRRSSTTSRRSRICRTSCATVREWFAAVGTERSHRL